MRALTIILAAVLSSSTVSAGDLSCESMQRVVQSLMKKHIEFRNRARFEKMLASDAYATRVMEKFYLALDPYKVFLFENEFEEATKNNNVIDEVFYYQNRGVPTCNFFAGKFSDLKFALGRHIQIMRKTFSSPNTLFAEMKDLVEKAKGLNEKETAYRKKLLTRYPKDEGELKLKAKLILADAYRKSKAAGESDRGSYIAALRYIRGLRTEYEFHEQNSVRKAVVKAYLGAVENHTQFYTEREYAAFLESLSSGMAGLGISVVMGEKGVFVAAVTPGGPAEEQKLIREGDTIVGVKGDRDIVLKNLEKVLPVLKGDPGTKVELTLLRNGRESVVTATRGVVASKTEALSSEVIKSGFQNLGYIRLASFYSSSKELNLPGASKDIAKKISEMNRKNVDGLIFDLRYNPGGNVEEVSAMAGLFLPKGPVVALASAVGSTDLYRIDDDNHNYFKKPVVIMVNGASASAAEILAGALQDYNRVLVVGDGPTFGKGSAQSLQDARVWTGGERNPNTGEITGGDIRGGYKVTNTFYFLPSGRSIQHTGVQPDITFPTKIGDMYRKKYSEKSENPVLGTPEAMPNFLEAGPRISQNAEKWMSDWDFRKALGAVKKAVRPVAVPKSGDEEKAKAVQVLSSWIKEQPLRGPELLDYYLPVWD